MYFTIVQYMMIYNCIPTYACITRRAERLS